MNQNLIKTLILLPIILITVNCSTKKPIPKEIEVKVVEVPVEIYQPPLPAEIHTRPIENAVVITRNNIEDKITHIEKVTGQEFVVIGYTPATYENLSWNLQEMRRYINELKEIIFYYRKATQVIDDLNNDGTVDMDDWVLENERLRKNELPKND